jgi:hypothetical protein
MSAAEVGVTYELVHEDGSSLIPQVQYVSWATAPFSFPGVYPAGSYRVKAFYANSGCDTLMNGTVIVMPTLIANAGPNQTVCTGDTVHLTGTYTGPANSVHWSGGAGTFSPSPQNLNVDYYPAPGETGTVVTLTLTVTNEYCTNSDQVAVTIADYPQSNFVVTSTGSCPGEWIKQNGSQANVQYELYRDGVATGIIKPGPGPLDFGSQWTPGTYTVKGTVTGSDCSSWMTGSPVIVPGVTPNDAGPISGLADVCRGVQNVPYHIDLIVGASSYIWVMPPGATVGSGLGTTDITVNYSSTFNQGNILVFGLNACAAGNYSLLYVTGHTLTGSILLHDTLLSGSSLCRSYGEITTSAPDDAFVVNSGGAAILRGMVAAHLMPGTRVYTGGYLSASVMSCLACGQQKMTETTTDGPGTESPEEQPANSDDGTLIIYPNPSEEFFNLILPGTETGVKVDLVIYNARGEALHSETFENSPVNRFPLKGMLPGICFVRCVTSSGQTVAGKFIKR